MGKFRSYNKGEKHPRWGKHCSEKTKEKIRNRTKGKYIGKLNPFFGKTHSKETRKVLSEKASKKRGKSNPFFGKHHSDGVRKHLSLIAKEKTGERNPFFGKHHSPETIKKLSEKARLRIGKKSPNWLGGKSFEPYTIDWTLSLKRVIRERDHYTCQLCGELQSDRAFDVHHIDYDKKNCNPKNLITLCKKCNSKVNGHRDYWTNYFKIKLTDKF